MSSIFTRTLFVDQRNGQVRFLDFCIVGTSLGTMVEPRNMLGNAALGGTKAGFDIYNPNDQCSKITKIDSAEQWQKRTLFGGLHGGEQLPQDYTYQDPGS